MFYTANNNFDTDFFFNTIKLKKNYITKIENKIVELNTLHRLNNDFYNIKNCNVAYIVHMLQNRTNTVFHITDSLGNLLYSCNASALGFTGKAKRKARNAVLKKFTSNIISSNHFSFLKNQPIALHLKNVGALKRWVVKSLQNFFYIENIRFFNTVTFNGCRNKKIRRKKIKKK